MLFNQPNISTVQIIVPKRQEGTHNCALSIIMLFHCYGNRSSIVLHFHLSSIVSCFDDSMFEHRAL